MEAVEGSEHRLLQSWGWLPGAVEESGHRESSLDHRLGPFWGRPRPYTRALSPYLRLA